MTTRSRHAAFAVAAAIVLAVAVLPGWILPDHGPRPEGRSGATAPGAERRPKATVQDAAAENAAPEPASDHELPPAREPERGRVAALRSAREFVGAFLRYEVGEDSSHSRRTIRGLAEPRLARTLLAAPPRTPSRHFPRRGRLISPLRLARTASGFEAVGLVRYGKRPSPVYLTIERRSGKWMIAAIG